MYKNSLNDLNVENQFEVKLIDQDVVSNFVPEIKGMKLLKELKVKGMLLTDLLEPDDIHTLNIQILLGVDMWSRIMTPEFVK